MAMLPTPKTPSYTLTLPDGQAITYYSMTKGDEKALLMVNATDEVASRIGIVSDIVERCTKGRVNPRSDERWLTEYLFIKLRSRSIDPVATIEISDPENPGVTHKMGIDFENVYVDTPDEEFQTTIKLEGFDEQVSVQLRKPTVWDYNIPKEVEDKASHLLYNCLEAIYSNDDVIEKDTLSRDDFMEWLDAQPSENIKPLYENMKRLNTVKCNVTYDGEEGGHIGDVLSFFIFK